MKTTTKLTRQGVRDLGGNSQRKKKPLELPPEPDMESGHLFTDDNYPSDKRFGKRRDSK